jgi:hypothetical protein
MITWTCQDCQKSVPFGDCPDHPKSTMRAVFHQDSDVVKSGGTLQDLIRELAGRLKINLPPLETMDRPALKLLCDSLLDQNRQRLDQP